MKGERVYLAILEDRHIDTVIEVFMTCAEAIDQLLEWDRYYLKEKGYTFTREDVEGWLLYIRSGEDTPWMRIEEKEIK